VLFFTRIPFVVNCTFNATSTERLQQYTWIRVWSMSHDLTLNPKPKPKTKTQNQNPKPKPKTETQDLNPRPIPKN